MTTLLTIALVAVAIRIGIGLVSRRRRTTIGTTVTQQWLHNERYKRDGDDRQWK